MTKSRHHDEGLAPILLGAGRGMVNLTRTKDRVGLLSAAITEDATVTAPSNTSWLIVDLIVSFLIYSY